MAEDIFLRVIQKMDRSMVKLPAGDLKVYLEPLNETMKDLRIIMDFMRDNRLAEGYRLTYLIADLVELAQNYLKSDFQNFHSQFQGIQFWLNKLKTHVLRLGDDEERPETVGEGDGDVVGLGDEVKLVLDEAIFDELQELQHIQIGGMIGIGKTTMARQLYNHEKVVDQFKRRAWLCVSGVLSYKELLVKLTQQLGMESFLAEMERADIPSLQQMLWRHLQGMRYFIVIDDLPQDMNMEPILKGLPSEDTGSRLLITSQSGLIQPRTHYDHEMKTLDSDDSWQLFLKTISCGNEFTNEDEFPKQLEKKGKEMLISKCGGLPLAIKEVGKQLAEKRLQSRTEWEVLFESIDFSSTLVLLEVFYNDLDPLMKSHFLHLAFFKENTSMREDKLDQIWAAGGMVLDAKVKGYALRLDIDRSILEIDMRTDSGMKSCHVNPIMHKLSIKKAMEELGLEIVSSNGNNRPSRNPRHRVIICSREMYNYFTNQDKHLVSLFFHGGGYFDASPSYWKDLELLRILDWEDFGLKRLPEGIDTLMELRYLGLRNNYVKELPDSLGSLKKLEILDIAQNYMVEVPDIIWKMDSLCEIYMSDIICRKPLKIEGLQDLEILTYISVDNCTYELSSLQLMTSLSKLGIEEVDGKSDISKLFASLAKLENLNHLILRGFRFRRMPCLDELGILHNVTKLKLDGLLASLPTADNFPPNITCLVLVNSHLHEDPMAVLEKLSKLIRLKLRNAYTGRQMIMSQNRFPELTVLCIEELRNLRNVQVGKGTMPKLSTFKIKNCQFLETLPEEIGLMKRLYQFKMVTTRKISRKIRKPSFIKDVKVDINPET